MALDHDLVYDEARLEDSHFFILDYNYARHSLAEPTSMLKTTWSYIKLDKTREFMVLTGWMFNSTGKAEQAPLGNKLQVSQWAAPTAPLQQTSQQQVQQKI